MQLSHFSEQTFAAWSREFETRSAESLIRWAVDRFGERIALLSSFGPESMVILHLLSIIGRKLRVLTLDTGRLPQETHDLMRRCEERFGIGIEIYMPDPAEVREMVRLHGINLFYSSVKLRQLCCRTRKAVPLEHALRGLDAWMTGLRREQLDTRAGAAKIELDRIHNDIVKINPLADWTGEQVWQYVREHELPYNSLHERGYTSIGCAPCTRPVAAGEDIRAGRWWWERDSLKECGIHYRFLGEAAPRKCPRSLDGEKGTPQAGQE